LIRWARPVFGVINVNRCALTRVFRGHQFSTSLEQLNGLVAWNYRKIIGVNRFKKRRTKLVSSQRKCRGAIGHFLFLKRRVLVKKIKKTRKCAIHCNTNTVICFGILYADLPAKPCHLLTTGFQVVENIHQNASKRQTREYIVSVV
jgi:hypothetical protein